MSGTFLSSILNTDMPVRPPPRPPLQEQPIDVGIRCITCGHYPPKGIILSPPTPSFYRYTQYIYECNHCFDPSLTAGGHYGSHRQSTMVPRYDPLPSRVPGRHSRSREEADALSTHRRCTNYDRRGNLVSMSHRRWAAGRSAGNKGSGHIEGVMYAERQGEQLGGLLPSMEPGYMRSYASNSGRTIRPVREYAVAAEEHSPAPVSYMYPGQPQASPQGYRSTTTPELPAQSPDRPASRDGSMLSTVGTPSSTRTVTRENTPRDLAPLPASPMGIWVGPAQGAGWHTEPTRSAASPITQGGRQSAREVADRASGSPHPGSSWTPINRSSEPAASRTASHPPSSRMDSSPPPTEPRSDSPATWEVCERRDSMNAGRYWERE